MLRLVTLLILTALQPAAGAPQTPCPPAARQPDRQLAPRIDTVVDAALAEGFAGGVALMRDGALIYERVAGFSDARGRVPVTEETLFHVASIGKYVTATLALKAVDEGRIGLTDPVAPLAPGTRLAERGVTFLDLLAHRSGLASSYAAERHADAAAALAAIDSQPVDGEAAGRFRYSNDGYDLLAILLERVYGRPFEELARDKLFGPACLATPRFWGEVELTDPTVVSQPLSPVRPGLRKRSYGMLGSAGLLVTAADLVHFQHAVASGRVLSPAPLAELTAPRGEMPLGQAALGAFLVDHPRLGRVLSARGYEDWGDNAILNHYLDHELILAVVTSKGPAEGTGAAPFRSRISGAIEELLAPSRPSAASPRPAPRPESAAPRR